jgi:DNA-binding LacI/PurR family transcriptional regulator
VLFPVTRERLAGYRQAAEDTGLAWREVVIAVCARNDTAEAEQMATSCCPPLSGPTRSPP